MKVYRGFINQPSSLQPLHAFHGKRGIVIEKSSKNLTIYFHEGKLISVKVLKEFITPFTIS